ncbi:hypothetical protein MHI32_16115 [Paenibacillus sp. FSL H7-0690]|uniref:hypothetical protein n=1 Tax=Paenibacillus sp. FSL H7-0690 TaxID=2921437 RepID=UPI0030ED1D15
MQGKDGPDGPFIYHQLSAGAWGLYQTVHTTRVAAAVGGQEHSPIRARAQRGFSVLRDQVLVLCSGQELDPIAENGQEHGTIADLIII